MEENEKLQKQIDLLDESTNKLFEANVILSNKLDQVDAGTFQWCLSLKNTVVGILNFLDKEQPGIRNKIIEAAKVETGREWEIAKTKRPEYREPPNMN